MASENIKQRFVREMKANPAKTAVLTALLLVGLCVWVPPLVGAISGGSSSPKSRSAAAKSPRRSSTTLAGGSRVPASQSGSTTSRRPQTRTAHKLDWQSIRQMAATDPLLRPADSAELDRDPFAIDAGQFPLTVEFASDTPAAPVKKPSLPAHTQEDLNELLVLKSTMIGTRRRGAWINDRLFFEGGRIRTGGQVYDIKQVHSNSVVITRYGQTYVLKINDRNR